MADSNNAAQQPNPPSKSPPVINPPKDDPISVAQLAEYDGTAAEQPTYVAIKGTVFDVSGNASYAPGGSYHVFAGKDASRALAKSSLKIEDCSPKYEDLDDKEKKVLDDWYAFFSKRYSVVGKNYLGYEPECQCSIYREQHDCVKGIHEQRSRTKVCTAPPPSVVASGVNFSAMEANDRAV